MKKTVVIHIIVMVIAVLAGGFLASSLIDSQAELSRNVKISNSALGGFNKFAADVQWMFFVNYAGGLQSVEKENVPEIYKRVKTIIGNDPNMQIAYEVGGMMFSVRDPKKAVEIFTKGANNPNLKDNWKLPFLAAHILQNNITDEDDPERLEKAIKMYRLAIVRNNAMPYFANAMMRAKAQIIKKRGSWNGKPVVNDRHAYLCALYDEWRKGGGGDEMETSGQSFGIDIKPMLLDAAQKAKASAPTNKDVLNTIDMVMKKVLEDQHLCAKCLTAYGPGDKFCTKCGTGVQVYGVCSKCGNVLKGEFCAVCGTKNNYKK